MIRSLQKSLNPEMLRANLLFQLSCWSYFPAAHSSHQRNNRCKTGCQSTCSLAAKSTFRQQKTIGKNFYIASFLKLALGLAGSGAGCLLPSGSLLIMGGHLSIHTSEGGLEMDEYLWSFCKCSQAQGFVMTFPPHPSLFLSFLLIFCSLPPVCSGIVSTA